MNIKQIVIRGRRKVWEAHGKIFATINEAMKYDKYVQAIQR